MRQGADHVQPLTDQSKPVKPWSLLPGPGFSESVCWVPHHTIDAVIISFMCFNKNILKGSTGCVITPDESRLSSVTKLELDILNVFSLTPSPVTKAIVLYSAEAEMLQKLLYYIQCQDCFTLFKYLIRMFECHIEWSFLGHNELMVAGKH